MLISAEPPNFKNDSVKDEVKRVTVNVVLLHWVDESV